MVKVNNKTDSNETIYDFEQVNPDWVGKTTRASI